MFKKKIAAIAMAMSVITASAAMVSAETSNEKVDLTADYATSERKSGVDLSWDGVSGAYDYVIMRAEPDYTLHGKGEFTFRSRYKKIAVVKKSKYTDWSVRKGKTYRYYVVPRFKNNGCPELGEKCDYIEFDA